MSLFLPLLLCACFQRVTPIRALETADGVAFELPALADTPENGRKRELLELMVTKRNCAWDCTMWFVERTARRASRTQSTHARVLYGAAIAGTVVRTPARELAPAPYAVAATVQQYGANGELVRSVSLAGEFAIYRDAAGQQHVARKADASEASGKR